MHKFALLSVVGLGCLVGVVLSALRLPGIWLIVGGAALMGWPTNWELVGVAPLLWMCGLAVLSEVLEFLMSALLTQRAGGSRKAAWGALLGGFIGLLFFSIPLPIVGSMIGALLGCFLGAAIGELSVQGSVAQGTRVGFSAAVGFAMGVATKIAFAFILSIIVIAAVTRADWPNRAPAQAAPVP